MIMLLELFRGCFFCKAAWVVHVCRIKILRTLDLGFKFPRKPHKTNEIAKQHSCWSEICNDNSSIFTSIEGKLTAAVASESSLSGVSFFNDYLSCLPFYFEDY